MAPIRFLRHLRQFLNVTNAPEIEHPHLVRAQESAERQCSTCSGISETGETWMRLVHEKSYPKIVVCLSYRNSGPLLQREKMKSKWILHSFETLLVHASAD
jgi:hypothetical protein